ncbi:MAG: aldo/keto reductase [Planctomycetota bacterium]|jgi:predicted aldo/keto reductase-like oxidoreductase|nr:aldo/keto reductase [Planctomycetota bacterium]
MLKRLLGNTGIEVSVIGLGGEHLDGQPASRVDAVIGAALDQGISIMDVFMPGKEVRENIGQALAGKRDKVCLQGMIGSVDLSEQYDISRDLAVCQRYFEDLLRYLKTDYIDFGMLFFLDSPEDIDAVIDNGVVDYARRLKREGKIRAVGASAHNPDTARRLVEEGLVETLLFSINPAFDLMPGSGDIQEMLDKTLSQQVTVSDPKRAELYRLCQSRGVGITVMKGLGAGKLLSLEHSPFHQALTPAQCIHYALTRPAVASVLVGCRSVEEVVAATAYNHLEPAELDYSQAVSSFKGDARGGFQGSCVYCNHCLPCPAKIDIASVNKYLDIARLDPARVPPGVRMHYQALPAGGSECVECGNCEKRCPFAVPIRDNMRLAAQLFSQ